MFARPDGRPLAPDTVRRYGLLPAIERAGLDPPGRPRLRFHDLRHTYASLLIAQGENVAFVSRQLGHASVSTTLDVYTHAFDATQHANTARERMETRFAGVLAASENDTTPAQLLPLNTKNLQAAEPGHRT